ncbi:3'-5' exonuclease [Streptomyces sp. AA1529]|uniref:3'-5' exonuclease n=1 Tax=Streptomyces sp. AA1529 TaxID=1203257 RepID=UPI003D742028
MGSLIGNLRGTTFVVIDFEALTPAGRPAEPTEVAALALVVRRGRLVEDGRFASLIRPPSDVPVTARDLAGGMTEAALRSAPPPAEVLAGLERRLTSPPYRLVAQHASTEAGLIARQAPHCPTLGATPMLDTLRLAKRVLRGLSSYGLDALLRHYGMPPPRGRHRAMPDVEATAEVFRRLLADGARAGHWSTLLDLDVAAGLRPKPAATAADDLPVQGELFGPGH